MAGKLSFSIAVNLLTENFKKGTGNVKNAFRSMQAQILTFAAAMGFAGVSLSNLFSQLVQTARETSKAVTALKNVSGSTAQFASNLQFTTGMAKKYGAYVNDLTANFAKFSVAASISGMAMEDQRKLFESLSRAAAGFGMSADESNGMFLAVTQMMGKGKIQAEELRGQLGERLPIAMQAMAKAAGTTVAGLDKIMKKGNLLSADVLPKFADALNEMLPNVDTDNIETSLNRLKNAFRKFTENTGIQGAYKSMIDGLTGFVNYAKDKMSTLITFISALIAGKLLANVAKFFQSQYSFLNASVRKHEVAEMQKQLATDKRIKAENLLAATQRDYETIVNGQRLASEVQLEKAKSAVVVAKAAEKKAIIAATLAAEKGAAIQSMGFWKKSGAVIVSGAKNAGKALRAIWSTVGPMLLITAISAIIAKLVDMYAEAKRIKNIFSDYKKEVSQDKSVAEIAKLNALKSVTLDITANLEKRKAALNELNSMLNTSYSIDDKTLEINKDINDEIDKRIKLLKSAARADIYVNKQVETEDKLDEIYNKYGGKRKYDQNVLSEREKEGSIDKNFKYGKNSYLYSSRHKIPKGLQKDIDQVEQYNKILSDIKEKLKDTIAEPIVPPPAADVDEPEKKKTPLQKEEEKYTASVKELTSKLANRAIAEEDYKKQLNDLNKTTYNTLSGMLTPEEAAKNKTYQTVKGGFSADPSPLDEVQSEYKKEMDTYARQLERGVLTEEEVNKARLTLIEKILSQVAGMDNIGQEGIDMIKSLTTDADTLREKSFKRPEVKSYDSTFDYKKTDTDILSGKLSVAKDNLDNLKAAYKEVGKEMGDELNAAMNNITSLEDALKIAEVRQDIDNLSKQLSDGIYSGVKDIASSADRLVSAFSGLRDVFSDEDATAWERIMAVWNTMINMVDAFMSIIQMIETMKGITEELGKAKEKEAAIDLVTTTTKIANTEAGVIADTTATAAESVNATTKVAQNTAVAASGAAASVASIPVVGWVMAGLAVAGIIALMASLPKFARGGIVQGSPVGDLNLARVNGGEMILNGNQQATLFQLANGKGVRTQGTGIGKVEFFVKGKNLHGVLDAHNDKTSKYK